MGRRSQKRAAKRSSLKAGTAPARKPVTKKAASDDDLEDSDDVSDEENDAKMGLFDGGDSDSDDAPIADDFQVNREIYFIFLFF